MGIKQITPQSQIKQWIEDAIARQEALIISNFQYVGERCIVQARKFGSYVDQTGNLRSSIGYMVIKNGKIVGQAISEGDKGSDRATGVSEGKKFMEELASKYTKGIVLVVVAGMKYAAAVESKGKDVLASSELLAERLVPEMMDKLGFK